jgi:hypothetical protein
MDHHARPDRAGADPRQRAGEAQPGDQAEEGCVSEFGPREGQVQDDLQRVPENVGDKRGDGGQRSAARQPAAEDQFFCEGREQEGGQGDGCSTTHGGRGAVKPFVRIVCIGEEA